MFGLIFSALLSTADAGTIYGIDDVGGGAYNWFAFDVATRTRSVLGPYNGPLDPARPGDMAWNEFLGEMWYIPGGPYNHNMYRLDLHTGAEAFLATYTPDLNTISWDTSSYELFGLNLGTANADYTVMDPQGEFVPYLPFPVNGTQGFEMVGFAYGITIDPATGEVYMVEVISGTYTAVGNIGVAIPGVRALALDSGANQILMLTTAGVLYELDASRTYQATLLYRALGDVMAMEVVPRPTSFSPRVTEYGTCPGPETLVVSDMTPGGSVVMLTGAAAGLTSVPSGPCAGTLLPISAPRLVATVRANALGEVTLSPTLPAPTCGKKLMAVDMATCAITNVITL